MAAVIVAACGSDVETPATTTPGSQDAGPDVAVPTSVSCTADAPAICTFGGCTLALPRGQLPAGAVVTLAERVLPAELGDDALGTNACEIVLPEGVVGKVGLTVNAPGQALPDSSLFRLDASGQAYLVAASTSGAAGVTALVGRSGLYGVTRRPSSAPRLETTIGTDVQTSETTAALLRNLATRGVQASFFDGTRFFVGNGNRVLVYMGLPASPATKPDLVLGEPDLDTPVTGVSSASFGAAIRSIWSDGTRLVVGTGSRVLVWNQLPATSYAPADFVLGQPDFSGQAPNAGGVSGASLSAPRAIDSNGAQLLVADTPNNRVLVWTPFPALNGEPASSAIGQSSLTSNVANGGAIRLSQSSGIALVAGGAFVANSFTSPVVAHVADLGATNPTADFSLAIENRPAYQANVLAAPGSVFRAPGGALGIVDSSWRIAMFRSAPTASVSTMDFVLGMPDATRSFDEPVSGASLATDLPGSATHAASSDSVLTVANGFRSLIWDTPPSYSFEPASRVVGQAGFSTNRADLDYRKISAKTLAGPADVAISGTHVAVADRDNNRVLLFDTVSLGTVDPSAAVVLGQVDAGSYVPNLDQRTPNEARLNAPTGVAFAGGRLVVADTENHRVLIWNAIPATTGTPADIVLGQDTFAARRPNHGRGDVAPRDGFSDAGADGFFYPTGVASDGTRLFVADRLNNRVLVWSTFPTTNDAPADRVIGQPSMSALLPNRGLGRYRPSPGGFNLPSRLLLDGSTLWVSDTENNRVVRVDDAATTPVAAAFLGQVDGSTVSNSAVFTDATPYNVGYPAGTPATTSGSVLRPQGLAIAGNRLYVSELTSNRVHVFDRSTLASLGALGQADLTTGGANAGGLSPASLSGALGLAADGERLLVADTNNNRVIGHALATPPGFGARSSILLGQPSFFLNGFDQAVPASAGGASRPRGLVRDRDELYVAESDYNRVVVTNGPPATTTPISQVIGQPDESLRLANSGGAPSAATLRNPRDVAVDATHIAIADSANHRVLVYPRGGVTKNALLVLGQSRFDSVDANRGGPVSASSLSAPQGIVLDRGRVIVADSGNNRILIWNGLPTANGTAADIVLGQLDASAQLSNGGQSAPSAATMAQPVGVKVVGDDLFVADSGNNRLLRFDLRTLATGASAAAVLGQPDSTSRATVADPLDTSRLGGPTGLAVDGSRLYVADRDLSRVVIYSLASTATGAPPIGVLSARSGFTFSGPTAVSSERTPFFTTRLFVADTNANRTVTIASLTRLLVDD